MANIKKAYTLDDWYKMHNVTDIENGKPEGMSDADYSVGQYLYNQQKRQDNLKSGYDTGVSELGSDRDKAIADASILQQRMEKYLPQQLAAQGLYGTGISEDAYLKLAKQYNDSVSNANTAYGQGVTALKSQYEANKLSLDDQTFEKVDAIQKEVEAEQKAAYNEAAAVIEAGFDTAREYADYVDSVKGKVSEEDYKLLMNAAVAAAKSRNLDYKGLTEGTQMYNSLKESHINTLQTDISNYDSLGNGDDIKVKVGDTTVTVESNGKVDLEEIKNYATERKMQSGTLFLHGSSENVYIYHDGAVYEVVSKSSSDKDRAYYNDLRHYLQYGTYGDNVEKLNNKSKEVSYSAKTASSWGRK